MLIVSLAVAALTMVLAVRCVLERNNRKDWVRKKIVHLPFFLAGIGMGCGGIFCLPTIVCARDGEWMFLFFAAFTLVCDCMMIAYLNCVIRYDDRGFEARNFFGINRKCDFGEVDALRRGRDCKVYFHGHWVLIDQISIGADDFIEALDRGHKRSTGRWVPSKERKRDPMNGNLEHPWGYFILVIVMIIGCIALTAMLWYSMLADTDPADVVIREVQFTDYEIREGSLLLSVQGQERPFRIDYYKDYEAILPTPEELCNGQKFLVGVEKGYYDICNLTMADGTDLITLEMERQVYRNQNRVPVWIITLFSALGVWICYMMIAVARNPERYPTWVRRLIYKSTTLR